MEVYVLYLWLEFNIFLDNSILFFLGERNKNRIRIVENRKVGIVSRKE